jgi:hypothetical protein
MAARDRRSHDQKRKAKLAKRSAKSAQRIEISPYSGRKYQKPEWAPQVYEVELAVYETILASNRTLTNDQVAQAFVNLITHLRDGVPAPLADDAPKMLLTQGKEVEYLVWNIRRHWRMLFKDRGPVASHDLVGILRTLLFSIEAREYHTGPDLGYVAFLEEFMQGGIY